MPWKERTAVDEKKSFLIAWERQEQSFSSLCRYFGISRPTGYKWLERFEAEGERGLEEQSRAPLQHQGDGGGATIAHPGAAGATPHVGAEEAEEVAGDGPPRHGLAGAVNYR
jgi:hypothetical protein